MRGEVERAVVAAGGYRSTTGGHVEKYFLSSEEAVATGIQQAWRERGGVGGGRSQVVMGERREGDGVFWYAGTETWEAHVGGGSCGGGGRGRQKTMAGEEGHIEYTFVSGVGGPSANI